VLWRRRDVDLDQGSWYPVERPILGDEVDDHHWTAETLDDSAD
jgi:hypothetical protein